MQLIAVIMASPNRDIRNNAAKTLLDFGFANYGIFALQNGTTSPIAVKGGKSDLCKLEFADVNIVIEKERISKIETKTELPEFIKAPVKTGDALGRVVLEYNGEVIGESKIVAVETIEAISYLELLSRILKGFCLS